MAANQFVQQTIGLDASGVSQGGNVVSQVFANMKTSIDTSVTTMIRFNEQGDRIGQTVKTISKDGKILTDLFADLGKGNGLEKVGSTIEVMSSKIADLKRQLREVNELNVQTRASTLAGKFVSSRINTADLPSNLIGDLANVQNRLTSAFAKDMANAATDAGNISRQLKSGLPGNEVGVRKELQDAIILLDKFSVKLEAERRKRATSPLGGSQLEFDAARGNALRSFPVPDNARLSDVVRFQTAFNGLFEQVGRGTLTLTQFKKLFDDTLKNPAGNISLKGKEFQSVQAEIQKLIILYAQLRENVVINETAANAFSKSALLGLTNIARLVQAQVLHRVLGGLITDFTNSVAASNKFQQQLGEILTIGDRTGISLQGFSDRIRDLSLEFNKTPSDVAEATYQALSNQVLNTANDFAFMTEALILARTTMSTATSAVNALSSVINAYHKPVSEAARISSQLFRAVDIGRFRLQDLGDTMGRVNVVANQLGISFEEVLGSLTALTRAGIPLAEAETQVRSVMQALEKPTESLQGVFRRLNVTSAESLITLRGFPGALRAILAEGEAVGRTVNDLFPNVRARALIGVIQNGRSIETDVARLRDPNAGRDAELAAQRQMDNVGERFRSQMNRIQTTLITEFGPKLTEGLLKLGEPFGGLDKLALNFLKTISDLSQVMLTLAGYTAQVIAFFAKWGPSLKAITIVVGSYYGAILLVNVGQKLWTLGMQSLGVTLSAMDVRLQRHVANINGVATGSKVAALEVRTLGAAMASLAIPVAIGLGVTLLIDQIVNAKNALEDLSRTVEAQQSVDERALRLLDAEGSDRRRIFEDQTKEAERQWIALLTPITAAANQARDAGRSLLRTSTDNLSAALGTAADEVKDKIRELEQRMNQAKNNIKESLKEITKFRDEIGSTLFGEKLNQLGKGVSTLQPFKNRNERNAASQLLDAENEVSREQTALISERIRELEAEATEAAQRGDQAGIESARRKFEEIRRLTQQQFQIETDMARRLREFQLRSGGQGGTFRFRVNTEQLRRSLDDVNESQQEIERNFQNMQLQIEAESRALLQLERARERNITSTQRALIDFTVVDNSGQLLERFRGPEGPAAAAREFDQLAAAARRALEPITLTATEFARLRQRVGENQAAGIRRALSDGSITVEQSRQLAGAVTTARLTALQAQLANHRATEESIREVERRIGEQRNVIQAQLTRERIAAQARAAEEQVRIEFEALRRRRDAAQQQLRDQTSARFEALRVGQNNLGVLASGNAPGQSTRFQFAVGQTNVRERDAIHSLNLELQEAARNAERLREVARRTGSDEDTRAFADELTRVRNLYDELLRRQNRFAAGRIGTQRIGEVELTAEQRESVDRLTDTRNRLNDTQTAITVARDAIASAEGGVNRLNTGLGTTATNLSGVAVAAADIGRNIQQGLDPVTQRLGTLATTIGSLARQLERLNGARPAVPRPAGQPAAGGNPGNFFDPGEGFAEGGLVGGRFNSFGPDDRVANVRTGEMIINPVATRKFYSTLVAINRGQLPKQGYSQGGVVTTNVGDISVNVQDSKDPKMTARAVWSHLKREFRRGSS